MALWHQSVNGVFPCCAKLLRDAVFVFLSLFLAFTLMLSCPSPSDASLQLCVMPKDEDILQLVSVCSSAKRSLVCINHVNV